MPSPSVGFRQALALDKAATWNTAVALGASDGILFLSGQAKRSATVQVDESRGIAFSKDGTAGPIDCSASYVFDFRYEGMDKLIAYLMGIAGAPTVQGATTAYKNTYKWSTDTYGLFLTVAKNMIAFIEEVPTAKVSKISLTGEVGAKPLQLTIDVIGSNREVASAVNTLATFASVTLPTGADRNPVMFSQTVFRMNDQGSTALGSGDQIYPSKFTLTIDRKLKGAYTGAYRTTGNNPQDLIDEPVAEGLPEIKLNLEFPTLTANTYLAALGSDSRKKLDITCTGGLIAGTYYYQHQLQFPHLQLVTADPTDDQGRIKQPLEFLVHGASTAPTGMTGITDPLWWTVINTRTTDPLA